MVGGHTELDVTCGTERKVSGSPRSFSGSEKLLRIPGQTERPPCSPWAAPLCMETSFPQEPLKTGPEFELSAV